MSDRNWCKLYVSAIAFCWRALVKSQEKCRPGRLPMMPLAETATDLLVQEQFGIETICEILHL